MWIINGTELDTEPFYVDAMSPHLNTESFEWTAMREIKEHPEDALCEGEEGVMLPGEVT